MKTLEELRKLKHYTDECNDYVLYNHLTNDVLRWDADDSDKDIATSPIYYSVYEEAAIDKTDEELIIFANAWHMYIEDGDDDQTYTEFSEMMSRYFD